MFFDPWGVQKGTFLDPLRISLRVRVCMCLRINIEHIGSYVHFWTAKFVAFYTTAFQSCEYFRLFDVCMDGPRVPKHSVFMMVSQLRVPPHTTEQNMSQNGLQESVFMDLLAGFFC